MADKKSFQPSLPELQTILLASSIISCTLVGVISTEYPIKRGNCFSVKSGKDEYKIVNFSYENCVEMGNCGVKFPIRIAVLEGRIAIVHDERIPTSWYDNRWCEICCPEHLLPLPQRLTHDREIKQGVRVVTKNCIAYHMENKPTL